MPKKRPPARRKRVPRHIHWFFSFHVLRGVRLFGFTWPTCNPISGQGVVVTPSKTSPREVVERVEETILRRSDGEFSDTDAIHILSLNPMPVKCSCTASDLSFL